MPGPIAHLIVQRRFPQSLNQFTPGGPPLASILAKDPCSPYAGFGSMGPDFLFFSVKEYGDPIAKLTNTIFDVYDAFEPLIEFYEKYIDPIKQQIDNAINTVDQALFKGLFAQLSATANLVSTTALTAVAASAVDVVDPFYLFYPKVQKGAAEKDWYWFDFLHYRRTGAFGSRLWQLAGNDADLQRYAVGYASHIATDVVGHPFVNAIVGGPYRMHWRRHKLVENWIDAYARKKYPDTPGTLSCLNIGTQDTYISDAISGSYYYRLVEFTGERLPDKLAKVFVQALQDVYGAIPHPPMLTPADVDAAYRLWLKWFERATTIGDARPPTPVPPPGSATINLVNNYLNSLPAFPGGPPSGGASSIGHIFEALFNFAKWVADVIAATFNWIINNAGAILLLPYTEALNLVKWLLYQIQKGIWEIYDNLRFELVLAGLLFPEPRDLAKMPWGKALLNTAYVQLTGGPVANFNLYPRKQVIHNLAGPPTHHLRYPNRPQESPMAEPAPFAFHGRNPEFFIDPPLTFDTAVDPGLYDAGGPYTVGAAPFTHPLDVATWGAWWPRAQFGNATEFSARLIAERLQQGNIPNFNLDGDRGYAWKTWRADDPPNIDANNPVPVKYIDTP